MNIEGSVAVVTGANRGLGRAYTEALLAGGAAKVYAAARNPSAISDTRLTPIRLDVTSPIDIAAAIKSCPVSYTHLDVYKRQVILSVGVAKKSRRVAE